MRLVQVVRMLALCSLLSTTAWVYAQDKADDSRPQEEMKPQQQGEAKPAKQDENAKQNEKKNEDKATKQEEKEKQQQDKAAKQDDSKSAKPVAQSGQNGQRASQGGGRIPDDKFRAHFGRQHTFSVHQTTVQGQPGFQYGGYSFIISGAWPVGWAYTDNCYIDYVDGEYILFDLLHPGVQVMLVVVL